MSVIYKKLGIGGKEPEYTEVRKSTSFGGADQWMAKTVGIMVKEDLVEEVIEVKNWIIE